ncbi:MAG: bifunctional (p)ppGpp synthetase/guanosine-3',5'-bis(diphosphate) 3'-pyrophosphohydrolase, partial [Clostridia bacterium]|nr:bifunctional (p)ppGpp synthetase/guanosine-3',5'-bis(diphosphate) 3'-pyrophosphohydrolase [Clostridia bacterium]
MKNRSVADAIVFATEKHEGQTRKDGTPYIWHPIGVAFAVKRLGFPAEYQITALLHDVYEDTDTTYEELAEFGEDVAEAVLLLSKNHNPTNEEEYIDRIRKNHIAAVVKNCDRIFNLREAVEFGDPVFLEKYIKESKTFFEHKFSPALDEAIRIAQNAKDTRQKPPLNEY